MNRFVSAILAIGLFAGAASAQLSGTYTIDNTLPTGSGNYASFADAATDLTTLGVSGTTDFLVAQGAGTYAGFSLGQIPGTSAAAAVTFLAAPGPRPIISGAAPGFSQAVRIGTATSISSASLGTGPSYVTFEGFEVTGSASGSGILVFGSSFITVRNCVVHTTGSGINLTLTVDSVVEDCEVFGTAHIPGTGGSTSYSGGVGAYYLSDRNTFQRNMIHDCATNGIFIGSSGSTTPCVDNVVINNFIWNCATQSSITYAGGIAFRRATNSVMANNTILMDATADKAGIHMMGGSSASPLMPSVVSNNLVQHNGTGPAILTEYAGQIASVTQDYNAFDIAGSGPVGMVGTSVTTGTPHVTLLDWQTASAAEANSVAGPANFLGAADLHILPSSVAFNAGSTVPGVTEDIDGQLRPIAGIPDIGADETPATGLFASFTASVSAGPAPLSVTLTDTSFTSDPGGVQTWAWDVDNDGIDDYFTATANHTYTCPGTYSVKLTVTDASNPTSSLTRTDLISVGDYVFDLTTSGGGVGDLTISPVPAACYPAATRGFTLISLSTAGPVGAGPFLGIFPDTFTITGITSPTFVGNPLNFFTNGVAYPDGGNLSFPAGFFAPLAGFSLDAVEVLLDPGFGIVYVSNVARVTF